MFREDLFIVSEGGMSLYGSDFDLVWVEYVAHGFFLFVGIWYGLCICIMRACVLFVKRRVSGALWDGIIN